MYEHWTHHHWIFLSRCQSFTWKQSRKKDWCGFKQHMCRFCLWRKIWLTHKMMLLMQTGWKILATKMRCKMNLFCCSVKWPFKLVFSVMQIITAQTQEFRKLLITHWFQHSWCISLCTKVIEFALILIGNLKCNYPSFQRVSGAWHLDLPFCLAVFLLFLSAGFVR